MGAKKSPRRKKKGKRSPTHANRSASAASLKQALTPQTTNEAGNDSTLASTSTADQGVAALDSSTSPAASDLVNTSKASKTPPDVAGEALPAEAGAAAAGEAQAGGAAKRPASAASNPGLSSSWAHVDSMDGVLADSTLDDDLGDLHMSELDALLADASQVSQDSWQQHFQSRMPQLRSALEKDGGVDGEALRREALDDPTQLLTIMAQRTYLEKSKIQRRAVALHEQLVAKENEVSELRAQLPSTAGLADKLAAREAELAELRAEKDEAIASHRRQLNQLHDKVCSLETERTRVSAQLSKAQAAEARLVEDSLALERERDHASSSNQEQIDELEERSRKAETAMRASQLRLQQLETQLGEARASRDAVNDELGALRASSSEQLLMERRKATDARMALDGFKCASLRRESELQQATDKAVEERRQVDMKLRAARTSHETLVKEMDAKDHQLQTTESNLRAVQEDLAKAEEQKLELEAKVAQLAKEASDPLVQATAARFLPADAASSAYGAAGVPNPFGSLQHSLTSRGLALNTVTAQLDEVSQEAVRLREENRRLQERRDEEARRLDNLKKKSAGHQEAREETERLARKTKAQDQEMRRLERELEGARKRAKRAEASKGQLESEHDAMRNSYYKQGEKLKKLEQNLLEARVELRKVEDERAALLAASETLEMLRERDQALAQDSLESARAADSSQEEVAQVISEGFEREHLAKLKLQDSERERAKMAQMLGDSERERVRLAQIVDGMPQSELSLSAAGLGSAPSYMSPMASGSASRAGSASPTAGSPARKMVVGTAMEDRAPSLVNWISDRFHTFFVFFVVAALFFALTAVLTPSESRTPLTRLVQVV